MVVVAVTEAAGSAVAVTWAASVAAWVVSVAAWVASVVVAWAASVAAWVGTEVVASVTAVTAVFTGLGYGFGYPWYGYGLGYGGYGLGYGGYGLGYGGYGLGYGGYGLGYGGYGGYGMGYDGYGGYGMGYGGYGGYPGYGYAMGGYPYSTAGVVQPVNGGFGYNSAYVAPANSRTTSPQRRVLGIDEEPMVGSDGSKAMKIANVYPGTAAEKAGLKVGDVLRSVNGYLTEQRGNLAWIIANAAPSNELKLNVQTVQDGKTHQIVATLP